MKINLHSRFKSGQVLFRYEYGTDACHSSKGAHWLFREIEHSNECTWVDDPDDSKTVEVADEFKGAVLTYYTDRGSSVDLIGFTEAELEKPAPEAGWVKHCVAFNAEEYTPVETFRDWALGLGRVKDFTKSYRKDKAPNGDLLIEIPYEWGDQSARHYIVVTKEGLLVEEMKGTGDHTPIPTISPVGGWEYTTTNEQYEKSYWESWFEEYLFRYLSIAESLGYA